MTLTERQLWALGDDPFSVVCPICGQAGETKVNTYKRSSNAMTVMVIIAIFTCLWCLPFSVRPRKTHVHYCSACHVRLASKAYGRAPVLPSYVRDSSQGSTRPSATSAPVLPPSPLGAQPTLTSLEAQQQAIFKPYTIEGPVGKSLAGTFAIHSCLPSELAKESGIRVAVDALPPWTDSTQNAQTAYCRIVETWQTEPRGTREPEIKLFASEAQAPVLTARVQRPVGPPLDERDQLKEGYGWRFSVQTARGEGTTFTSPDPLMRSVASEENVECWTSTGPVFWEIESQRDFRLVDPFGRLTASYRIEDKRKVEVTVASGLEDLTFYEVLFVIILVLLEREKFKEWNHGQIRDD